MKVWVIYDHEDGDVWFAAIDGTEDEVKDWLLSSQRRHRDNPDLEWKDIEEFYTLSQLPVVDAGAIQHWQNYISGGN